ncbi:erythroid differentiation-related factor 1-like [Diaphorina citri]|uniref:Erythroid differentiation-related factor 1-like n=1 Tax=Diaphorina citri TaxID=121845 RepID=A0A3Q0IMX9_DIACI|nr:erythroid differentiation-related factor 1-like [Diaphorina citri]
MKKPINVLTGLDYWLDNLMCNVPEVAMCYHLEGIVQKYELIKTEDLPDLENSKFSPKLIRDVAQNILSFLKYSNKLQILGLFLPTPKTQSLPYSGALASYLLGRAGDCCFKAVQDWAHVDVHNEDLGRTIRTLCKAQSNGPSLYAKECSMIPKQLTTIKVSIDQLVARNMKYSRVSYTSPGTIRMLLKNCISLKGKNEEVVKLYDLTSLCSEELVSTSQNPFTVPVAMLLYRLGITPTPLVKRILHQGSGFFPDIDRVKKKIGMLLGYFLENYFTFNIIFRKIHRVEETLASLHHNSYRTHDDSDTKRKLAMLHYEKSARLLTDLDNISDLLRVQLERIALAEYIADRSSVQNRIKHLQSALAFAVQLNYFNQYPLAGKGIAAFELVQDSANLALLHSNMGRLMRLLAHANLSNEESEERKHYNLALDHYTRALTVLAHRKHNSLIWDTVTWELSTALYNLAVLSQEFPHYSSNKKVHHREEMEREVVDLLQKALKYCDIDTPSPRQVVYQYRAAIIHHRLASLHHNSYRTHDDSDTKRKLAMLHYEKSARLLTDLDNISDLLRVQLERIALAEYIADRSSVQNRIKHLQSALAFAVQCAPALDLIASENGDSCSPNGEPDSALVDRTSLVQLLEQRLQVLLKSLTKLCWKNSSPKLAEMGVRYKEAYSRLLKREGAVETHLSRVLSGLKQS